MSFEDFMKAIPESDTQFRFAVLTNEGHLISGLLNYSDKDSCERWLNWNLQNSRWRSILAPGENYESSPARSALGLPSK
jgi:hypothetical protein